MVKLIAGVGPAVALPLKRVPEGVPAGVGPGEGRGKAPTVMPVTLPVPVAVRFPEPSNDKPVEMVISCGEPGPAVYRPINFPLPERLARENTDPLKLKPVPAV